MTEGTTSTPVTTGLFALDAGLSRSYPFKLQTLTTQRYSGQTIQVLNAGHAGNQAVNDRGRFSDVIGDAKPELVLLLEGANDLNRPAAGESINARVRRLCRRSRTWSDAGFRGIPVMLATLRRNAPALPRPPRPPPESLQRRGENMAAKKGAQVVDVNACCRSARSVRTASTRRKRATSIWRKIWLDAIKPKYEKAATP